MKDNLILSVLITLVELSLIMSGTVQRISLAFVFLIWVLPRILPLLLYPGVYSFDSWIHLGYMEAILVDNHIPLLYQIEYPYISMPLIHIFTSLVHQLFGISLIDSMVLFAIILFLIGFSVYYALFRILLGNGYLSLTAMLFFAVAVDVISQTNSVIPENLALVLFGILLIISVKLLTSDKIQIGWVFLLPLLLTSLVFTHHLTSYFAVLFLIGLVITSALIIDPKKRRIGFSISISSAIFATLLILLTNNFIALLFRRYSLILIIAIVALVLIAITLSRKRKGIWRVLGNIKLYNKKKLFPILGVSISFGLFFALLFLYPYDRSLGWISLKFGLLCIFMGLSFSILNLLPWLGDRKNYLGLFLVIVIIILGLSFIYPAVSTLIDAAMGIRTVETAIGHRHFAFLLIPMVIASTIAVFFINRKFLLNQSSQTRIAFPMIALLLLILSTGGIYNLYWPVGGWYPEWCNQPEISTGFWISDNSIIPSTIIADYRLIKLMQGTYPIGSERFMFIPLNPKILQTVVNNTLGNETTVSPHYIFTSALAEQFSIIEFLNPPIQFNYSSTLDKSVFASKIFSIQGASVYCVN